MTVKYWTEEKAPEQQFEKAHKEDAGYDIRSAEAAKLRGGASHVFPTGLHVAIPEGYVGILKSRSGNAVNKGLEVGAGVIDSGYTGEVKVLMHNMSVASHRIAVGNKIAQMVIVPICDLESQQVSSLEELGESERGADGFGSTGR